MAPGNKPGINGAAGFQKGLCCESCHSEYQIIAVAPSTITLISSKNIIWQTPLYRATYILLNIRSEFSNWDVAQNHQSCDSRHAM